MDESKINWYWTIIIIPLLILIMLLILPSTSLRDIDTIYTADFTQQKFDQITVGMDKDQVHNILGEPFDKTVMNTTSSNPSQEWWQYSKSGKLGFSDLNDFIGGNYVRVFFDKEGKVTSKQVQVFY